MRVQYELKMTGQLQYFTWVETWMTWRVPY